MENLNNLDLPDAIRYQIAVLEYNRGNYEWIGEYIKRGGPLYMISLQSNPLEYRGYTYSSRNSERETYLSSKAMEVAQVTNIDNPSLYDMMVRDSESNPKVLQLRQDAVNNHLSSVVPLDPYYAKSTIVNFIKTESVSNIIKLIDIIERTASDISGSIYEYPVVVDGTKLIHYSVPAIVCLLGRVDVLEELAKTHPRLISEKYELKPLGHIGRPSYTDTNFVQSFINWNSADINLADYLLPLKNVLPPLVYSEHLSETYASYIDKIFNICKIDSIKKASDDIFVMPKINYEKLLLIEIKFLNKMKHENVPCTSEKFFVIAHLLEKYITENLKISKQEYLSNVLYAQQRDEPLAFEAAAYVGKHHPDIFKYFVEHIPKDTLETAKFFCEVKGNRRKLTLVEYLVAIGSADLVEWLATKIDIQEKKLIDLFKRTPDLNVGNSLAVFEQVLMRIDDKRRGLTQLPQQGSLSEPSPIKRIRI